MNLQGRNLSIAMQGEDVQLLQQELRQLGFPIEDEEAVFGESTRQVVLRFQKQNRLEPTGEVDEHTAKLINALVDGRQPEPSPNDQPKQFIVRGQISQPDGSPFVGALVRALSQELRDHERQLG